LNGGGTDNVGFAPTAQDVISNMIYWANDGHIKFDPARSQ
jgi:hypothetical protein